MNTFRAEWRRQRREHLLLCRAWFGIDLLIRDAIKTIPHPDVEAARTSDVQSQLVKRAHTSFSIEGRFVGPITDQVIAFLVVDNTADAATQVVAIPDCHAAGFLRQIVESLLLVEVSLPPASQLFFKYVWRTIEERQGQIVGRSQLQRLQPACIHCVDHYRSAARLID